MATTLAKVGPFGAGGTPVDIDHTLPPDHLKSIKIWYDEDGINGLKFSYLHAANKRKLTTTRVWGDDSGSSDEINIEDDDDYVNKLEGRTDGRTKIKSLRITTKNNNNPDWLGDKTKEGDYFSVPVEDGQIVAFFGRTDQYINALGVYILGTPYQQSTP
ncbi:salt stress-induced protein [Oryza sativa Japonica Group]|nr:salt stress-induced protein-like [Oryza sativa Japonica Group]EAZ17554.1 hypothetical protein OsJ_33089 [Oryza sativa Japonica Group]KAF2909678.1 hypothetical protein DAI22_11g043900 [Oryza sativa Japonica Group]BAF27679.1 Os11g0165700 [Oryza sativa Japonica Group]|eukprot:NP_001065834.1 Os11g0165700 [Oryza sativa Japonica Group]